MCCPEYENRNGRSYLPAPARYHSSHHTSSHGAKSDEDFSKDILLSGRTFYELPKENGPAAP